MFVNPEDCEIKAVLEKSKKIAVVGLSGNPEKDSNQVARYLIEKGYVIIPVNPMEDEILGLKSYKNLSSVPDKIDIVNVFRRSEYLPEIVEEVLKVKPGCIWTQLGIVDGASAEKAAGGGIAVIMDRCIKVEHRRLLGTAGSHEKK
ncbi:MAG: CoA-binding protein [Bacillota bacterium]